MVSWYKNKQEWLEVAPLSGVTKLFKQQTKELVGIRSSKLDYEMELETGTLTPSQRSYRRDELKMCKVHEKMAVNLISKMQGKIMSGRRVPARLECVPAKKKGQRTILNYQQLEFDIPLDDKFFSYQRLQKGNQ